MASVKGFAARVANAAMASTSSIRSMNRAPINNIDYVGTGLKKHLSRINQDLEYAGGEIVLHGSPQKNLATIEPRLGSAALPDRSVAYGWKTRGVSGYDDSDVLQGVAWNNLQNPRYTKPGNSIYIAQAKRGASVTDYDHPDSVFTTNQPMKVLAELSGDDIETAGRVDEMKMLDSLKKNLEKLGVTHHVKKATNNVIDLADDVA